MLSELQHYVQALGIELPSSLANKNKTNPSHHESIKLGRNDYRDLSPSKVSPSSISEFVKKQWPSFPEVTCHQISSAHVVVSQKVSHGSIRPGGFVSGPTQFGMVDLAMWFAVFGAVGFESMALTSECSIRFVRPAIGDQIWARVDIDSLSDKNVVMSAKVWTDNIDKPTCIAQGTYALPRMKK